MPPHDPIAAVTHPDPYPYYADLVARTPLYYDRALGLWVAASAAAVTAVLASASCLVRPPAEPVPAALRGSPPGDIFLHLVRMRDGPGHRSLKRAVAATLGGIDASDALAQSSACAISLSGEIVADNPASVSDFAIRFPVSVVARLLGVPEASIQQTTAWAGDFVRCLAPGSSTEVRRRGTTAANGLLALFRSLLAERQPGLPAEGLLAALAREVGCAGADDEDGTDVIVANSIGFLFQAYEATAGLIGSTLLALAAHRAVREQVVAEPGLLRDVILEVIRYDAPVQNTRRFLARDASIEGQELKAGDAVLVVLAAANRDPAANPAPQRFDPGRSDRRSFTYGVGGHACPGELLALTIAEVGVAAVLASGVDLARLAGQVFYRPSVNMRVPLFTAATNQQRSPWAE